MACAPVAAGVAGTGLAVDQIDLKQRGLAVANGSRLGARVAKSAGHGWSRRVSEDEQRAGLGQMAADGGGRVSLLEQFMPRFDTRSRHAIEVHAPAQAVFTAVEAVTVKEVRFLRELELIRALPGLAALGGSTCRHSTRR